MLKNIKQIIRESAEKALYEENLRNSVRELVREEFQRVLNEEDNNMKRKAVMSALKDPKFNHAQLAYDLYHPKDQSERDTVRSLFSKKASGEPDNDGEIRKFDDDEINKLYQMIRKR
jgi:hypothetical protein